MGELTYGSDLVVELLQRHGVDVVAFNPGASFRGIHDSLVHRGDPRIVLCTQEMVAVAVGHAYAKAAGRPMAVALHDVVGLQQASMAIYNAWCDRAPVLLLGGTGPVSLPDRRPWIDWIHTALVQGNQVRDYVKWDDQPADVHSVPESFVRAWTTATSSPPGPVYVCLDAGLQEQRLEEVPALPEPGAVPVPVDPAPDPDVVRTVAAQLRTARLPVLVTDYAGATDEGFHLMVQLAELLQAPVVDRGARLSFPTAHHLSFGMQPEILGDADAVVAIDVEDLYGALRGHLVDDSGDVLTRTRPAFLAHLTPQHYKQRSWSADHQRQVPCDLVASTSAAAALRALVTALTADPPTPDVCDARRAAVADRVEQARRDWATHARDGGVPGALEPAFAVAAVGAALEGRRWALASSTVEGWERRLWRFDRPRQHTGWHGGGGLGYGMGAAIGTALAAGEGTITVNLQADGDLLFTPSALWTAAHESLPILTVVLNNRQYGNSVGHAARLAAARGRDVATRYVGTALADPPVDFAGMARSYGVWGAGPVDAPAALEAALGEALTVVESGRPALVDVVTTGA